MFSEHTFIIINLSVKVGQHLQSMYGEGIMVSQSTICRFEKLEITAQQVERLFSYLICNKILMVRNSCVWGSNF